MQSTLEPSQTEKTAWEALPDSQTIGRTVEALAANGFRVDVVPDGKAALEKVRSLIPEGARVMTGSSTTLDQIAFTSLLASGAHTWVNLKGKILAEKDPQKQMEMRREATFADYFLGSVHAVTEAGKMVVGSAIGSQLAANANGRKNLIEVVGAQKIAADLDGALRRLREHTVPLEDRRMKSLGAKGTVLSKIFIYEKEPWRSVHVILVKELLGF